MMEIQITSVTATAVESAPGYGGPYTVTQSNTPPQIINSINTFGDEVIVNGSFEQMTMHGGQQSVALEAVMADGWKIVETNGVNPWAMIEANPDHRNTVEFSAGVVLDVPELPADTTLPSGLPPWRRP